MKIMMSVVTFIFLVLLFQKLLYQLYLTWIDQEAWASGEKPGDFSLDENSR